MPSQNSLNLNGTGVVSYNSTTGVFSESAITQHDVLVAGSGNSIVSVSPSTSGFVLTSNGVSADPSFQAPSASSFAINRVEFTTSGTYTPTAGMAYCDICLVGAGGGGGGAGATGGGQACAGGAGGSGGGAIGIFSSGTIGSSQVVTVGAFGAGGAAGTNNGSAGGTTSVGALISGTGGGGGVGGVASSGPGGTDSGSGGVGSGGDVQFAGQKGSAGVWWNIPGPDNQAISAQGGNSFLGSGGFLQNTAHANGNAAAGYGGGGVGGCNANASSPGAAGGNGFGGLVIITEYIASSIIVADVVETVTGNSGGAVSPLTHNLNLVGDGTTVNVVGNPGTHTLTVSAINATKPSFLAYVNTAIPNVTGDGTVYTIAYDATLFDTGSNFTTGSGAKFTAPVSGRYQFNCVINMLKPAAATNQWGYFVWNSTLFRFDELQDTGSTTVSSCTGSIILNMAATDTLQIQVQQTGGAKTGVVRGIEGGIYMDYFSGTLLS